MSNKPPISIRMGRRQAEALRTVIASGTAGIPLDGARAALLPLISRGACRQVTRPHQTRGRGIRSRAYVVATAKARALLEDYARRNSDFVAGAGYENGGSLTGSLSQRIGGIPPYGTSVSFGGMVKISGEKRGTARIEITADGHPVVIITGAHPEQLKRKAIRISIQK